MFDIYARVSVGVHPRQRIFLCIFFRAFLVCFCARKAHVFDEHIVFCELCKCFESFLVGVHVVFVDNA